MILSMITWLMHLLNNFYPLFSFIFVGIRKSNFQTHSYFNKTIYPLLLGINCIVQFSWNFFFAKFHFLMAIKCLKKKNFQGKRVLLKQREVAWEMNGWRNICCRKCVQAWNFLYHVFVSTPLRFCKIYWRRKFVVILQNK